MNNIPEYVRQQMREKLNREVCCIKNDGYRLDANYAHR